MERGKAMNFDRKTTDEEAKSMAELPTGSQGDKSKASKPEAPTMSYDDLLDLFAGDDEEGDVGGLKYPKLPPLFDGLTDEEKQDILDGDAHYQFLPQNPAEGAPDGYQIVPSTPFDATNNDNPDFDPVNLANNFKSEDLRDAIAESLRPGASNAGYGVIGRIDEDGEESFTTAPIAAIRDALQMQGEDPYTTINSVYDEAKTPDEEEEVAASRVDNADGTSLNTVTAPNGTDYRVRTRKNEDGSIDLVIGDTEGREAVESTGEEFELDEMNEMAESYAQSIKDGDQVGEAVVEMIDSLEPQASDKEGKEAEEARLAEEKARKEEERR